MWSFDLLEDINGRVHIQGMGDISRVCCVDALPNIDVYLQVIMRRPKPRPVPHLAKACFQGKKYSSTPAAGHAGFRKVVTASKGQ